MDEAIKEKYLVGYKVINRTSKLISEGIKLKKSIGIFAHNLPRRQIKPMNMDLLSYSVI